jgi:hypothetical protein
VIVAEGAEIELAKKCLEWNRQIDVQREAEQIEQELQSYPDALFEAMPGLIRKIRNPLILGKCIELLTTLRDATETDGPDEARDLSILEEVYGCRRAELFPTLKDFYRTAIHTSNGAEDERENPKPSPEVRQSALREIDRELGRLKQLQDSQKSIEACLANFDRLRLSIPNSIVLERLLKYHAQLDRSIARGLNQIERQQRLYQGQPPGCQRSKSRLTTNEKNDHQVLVPLGTRFRAEQHVFPAARLPLAVLDRHGTRPKPRIRRARLGLVHQAFLPRCAAYDTLP